MVQSPWAHLAVGPIARRVEDLALIYDTSANDVYRAMNGTNEATMMPASIGGFALGGSDLKSDLQAGGSLVGGYDLKSDLQAGTAYSRRAIGFDKYYAYAICGGTDEAHLFDSTGNDTLQTGNLARTKTPLETTLTYNTGPLTGMLLWTCS